MLSRGSNQTWISHVEGPQTWGHSWTLSTKTQLSVCLLEAWKGRAGRDPRDIHPFQPAPFCKNRYPERGGYVAKGTQPGWRPMPHPPLPHSWTRRAGAAKLHVSHFLSLLFLLLPVMNHVISSQCSPPVQSVGGQGGSGVLAEAPSGARDDLLREQLRCGGSFAGSRLGLGL